MSAAPTLDAADIVNGAEIARRLGVSRAAVGNWAFRYANYPAPLDTPGVLGISLYSWREVWAWRVRHATPTPTR